jgi:nicotinate-nucleotide adenylyltransferase
MQKIAILGGTFNPIHLGHLQIATAALAQFQLQQVIWVPVQHPAHKLQQAGSATSANASAAALASFKQRIEMLRLALADQAGFVYLGNSDSRTPSYAVDMLRSVQTLYPHRSLHQSSQNQWHWIIGQDALLTLPRWKGRRELAETCCWLVAPRSNLADPAHPAQAETICKQVEQAMLEQEILIRWQVIQMPPVLISSSLIRQRQQQGYSIKGLVTERVEQYILAHQLYKVS